MSSADLVRAQYAAMDFNTHLDDFRARIQIKYASDYNDFAVSSLGIMLLDSMAFGLDTLSFYLDRRATDTYLATARTRKSVSRLTRQLGYKMRAAVTSTVDLSVAVEPTGFDVTIPQRFQFQGPNQLVFENAEPVTWLSTDTGVNRTKNVSCYEGETISESFTADSLGAANQIFQLKRVSAQKFVVSGSVTVLVNGAPFQESEFITFDATDQFEVGYNDDPPTIRFGDGVAGNIPTPSATIYVTYVAARGKDGLVTGHTITKEKNPLVVSFQTIALTVDNPLGSVGGDDPETLAHAKIYAPQVYKSRFVAVTRPDYEALSGSFADPLFGRVAAAQAVSSRSADADSDLINYISAITTAINAPLFVSAGSVVLTGTATAAISGVVTGSGTKFLSELEVGSWVKFDSDPDSILRRVNPLTDDRTFAVTPSPATALASGPVYRYGYALTQTRSRLKDVSTMLVQLGTELNKTAAWMSEVLTTGLDYKLNASMTSVRSVRDKSVTVKLDAYSAMGNSDTALTDGTNGINNFITTPTQLGVGANNSVLYVPKSAGVAVQHVSGASTGVAVSGSSITVTFGGGATTADVASVVNADVYAKALVLAIPASTPAYLDLSVPGTLLNTVIESTTGGTSGPSITFASVADGSGVGTLTRIGSAFTLHYATAVTTVANVEALVNALSGDAKLIRIRTAGTGTNVLAAPGDTFGATNLVSSGTYVVDPSAVTPIGVFMPISTKNSLQDWIQAASDSASAAGDGAAALATNIDTLTVPALGSARQQAALVGRTITEGELLALSNLQASMLLAIGPTGVINGFDSVALTNDAGVNNIAGDLVNIETSVTDNEAVISASLTGIYNHVDRLLSLDCKANLVTVPILARDKAGFFTAPSNGLIRALQNYLDARKEVTQTVQVTSGANALVSAVIRARIGVSPNFSESVTKTAVESAIDSVLRDRSFGASLYLRELNQAVNGLDGVVFANIRILGPVGNLDTGVDPANPSDGNLIVTTGQVVTKGQVTVTTETVAGA